MSESISSYGAVGEATQQAYSAWEYPVSLIVNVPAPWNFQIAFTILETTAATGLNSGFSITGQIIENGKGTNFRVGPILRYGRPGTLRFLASHHPRQISIIKTLSRLAVFLTQWWDEAHSIWLPENAVIPEIISFLRGRCGIIFYSKRWTNLDDTRYIFTYNENCNLIEELDEVSEYLSQWSGIEITLAKNLLFLESPDVQAIQLTIIDKNVHVENPVPNFYLPDKTGLKIQLIFIPQNQITLLNWPRPTVSNRTTGVLKRCLEKDKQSDRPWCIYKHKESNEDKIMKPQPKGWPKHYQTKQDAKKALNIMKSYKKNKQASTIGVVVRPPEFSFPDLPYDPDWRWPRSRPNAVGLLRELTVQQQIYCCYIAVEMVLPLVVYEIQSLNDVLTEQERELESRLVFRRTQIQNLQNAYDTTLRTLELVNSLINDPGSESIYLALLDQLHPQAMISHQFQPSPSMYGVFFATYWLIEAAIGDLPGDTLPGDTYAGADYQFNVLDWAVDAAVHSGWWTGVINFLRDWWNECRARIPFADLEKTEWGIDKPAKKNKRKRRT